MRLKKRWRIKITNNGVLNLLGLAKKASKLCIGEDPCGDAVKKRTVCVLLTASDAAENTVKRANTYSFHCKAPHLRLNVTKEELGFALGRASCAICAITDAGFASAVAQKVATVGNNLENATLLVERFERITKRKNKEKPRKKTQRDLKESVKPKESKTFDKKRSMKGGGDADGNR